MSLSVTGRILHIGDVEVITDKFSKRTIVLDMGEEYNGQRYDNPVPFQVSQKKIDLANGFSVGQEVTVSFNLKGRKWERDGKTTWFGTNEIWRIEGQQAAARPQQPAPQPQYATSSAPVQNNYQGNAGFKPSPEDIDDLPF